jgi:hypothetical protein
VRVCVLRVCAQGPDNQLFYTAAPILPRQFGSYPTSVIVPCPKGVYTLAAAAADIPGIVAANPIDRPTTVVNTIPLP